MSYYYEGDGNFSTDAERRARKQSQPSQPPKKPDNDDMGAWIFIAVMLAVAWPIGLILLISKLKENSGKRHTAAKKHVEKAKETKSRVKSAVSDVTRSPADSDKSARVMKIVGICLAAVGAIVALAALTELPYALEYGYMLTLLEELFVSAGFVSAGGVLLAGSSAMKRRMRRHAKYLAVAGGAQTVSISRLAAAAEVSERRVTRDLELMIEKGLWGRDAYVDLSAGKLFRSAVAAREDEDRHRAPVTPPQAQQGYSGMLRQIRAANDRIADEVLSAKIEWKSRLRLTPEGELR